jgi:hypothetical protein
MPFFRDCTVPEILDPPLLSQKYCMKNGIGTSFAQSIMAD